LGYYFSIKSAWNKILKDKTILQYCLMYTGEISDKQFLGDFNPYKGATGQRQVAAGVNWCINYDRLKVGLHHVYAS
jgi:hypothetical protein